MAYRITTRVYQSDTSSFFMSIDKNVWNYSNGGAWGGAGGSFLLTLGGSGNSGTLRFSNEDDSEIFLVALGIQNDKPWVDIIPNLTLAKSGVVLHPTYYKNGTVRAAHRNKELSKYCVTNTQGRVISVQCPHGSGQNIGCDIIIS